uniref:Uncharacterized protein n=1 Tax=Lepeophtheirus salmonis TaxID=72036 RepID=A0A0K2V991_LEPSM
MMLSFLKQHFRHLRTIIQGNTVTTKNGINATAKIMTITSTSIPRVRTKGMSKMLKIAVQSEQLVPVRGK